MSHARVEEISDSDSDPDVMDITSLPTAPRNQSNASLIQPQNIPAAISSRHATAAPPAASKTWHILYPLYFDASASRVQGRRVGKESAVKNPLALTIADALRWKGLMSLFEPLKKHPKDWANPGRVRVRLRDENGKWVADGVNNKHHLYIVVAAYLQAHPTKPEDPLKLPVPGLPTPEGIPSAPAVPRGWRINEVLPLHSSAQTGGGVKEDMLKDFQAAMQGQDPGASAPKAIASEKKAKKKDKSKKK